MEGGSLMEGIYIGLSLGFFSWLFPLGVMWVLKILRTATT